MSVRKICYDDFIKRHMFHEPSSDSDESSSIEERVEKITHQFFSFYPWRDDPKKLTDFEAMQRVQQMEAHPGYIFKDIVSIYPIAARERLKFFYTYQKNAV